MFEAKKRKSKCSTRFVFFVFVVFFCSDSLFMKEHMFSANAFIRDYVETSNASETIDCPVCKCKVAIRDVVPEIVGLAEGQGLN